MNELKFKDVKIGQKFVFKNCLCVKCSDTTCRIPGSIKDVDIEANQIVTLYETPKEATKKPEEPLTVVDNADDKEVEG